MGRDALRVDSFAPFDRGCESNEVCAQQTMNRGMRIRVSSLLLSVQLTVLATASAAVLAPGAHVADFTLQDETGLAHQLYALSEKKAVVVMTQSNGCPIVRLAVPALREIRDRYRSSDIEFLLLNPTLQNTRDAVLQEAAEFQFWMTVLLDRTQKVAEAWCVNRTAAVIVIY